MTRLLPLLLLGALLAHPAFGQTTHAVAWPEDNPIWELDIVRPAQSSGPDGSGLEIRDVRYHGRMVLKRGHVPILNVKYEAGCNCFRDWQDTEVVFQANNPINAWVAESTPGSVATMCDVAPANCIDTNGDGEVDRCNDVGTFRGVAIERFEEFLRLTTHLSAGWYRYTMKWEFHADGTIRPLFGFTSTGTNCTQNPRRHHAYWRFDFDIDGAEHDYVEESRDFYRYPEFRTTPMTFRTETLRTWGDPEDLITWRVRDTQTGLGYEIIPSENDYLTPANPNTGNPALDNFAKEDFVVARYAPDELADSGFGCEARFTPDVSSDPIVDGESVYDTDVVLWYRAGVTKPDIDPGHCYESGPVLKPIGDWARGGTTAGEDAAVPAAFTLEEAYPNPFSNQTTLRFSVQEAQHVTLTLYDGLGREVRTLFEGSVPAGAQQTVTVDAANLPAGTYTVRLEGASVSGSTRIVLVR